MARKYGRGKFEAHPKYIKYMEMIVDHAHYSGMPGARTDDGHINWQVSSGKTTSFNRYYEARRNWWAQKAEQIAVSAADDRTSRLSLVARKIHPSGLRPCRLCGQELFVGYRYLNKSLANRWNKKFGAAEFLAGQEITEAYTRLLEVTDKEEAFAELNELFPEKLSLIPLSKGLIEVFSKTDFVRSVYLSPGFMSNPPDRLDGFHDYGICCRKLKDPGRSDINLRSYIHDRRTFKWWSEGDWLLTDRLYNSAGAGKCAVCGTKVPKVSPDHIGPLACGFKQIPLFTPMCQSCNSAKNRRMTYSDVQRLMAYEQKTKQSVASWQIRTIWDKCKTEINDDQAARALSATLRSCQDYYFRRLYDLLQAGHALYLSYLLSPDLAHFEIKLNGLDSGLLTFTDYLKTSRRTTGSLSLEARIIRIAFDELKHYVSKELKSRKLYTLRTARIKPGIRELERAAKDTPIDDYARSWSEVILDQRHATTREKKIRALLTDPRYQSSRRNYRKLDALVKQHFEAFGNSIIADFQLELGL